MSKEIFTITITGNISVNKIKQIKQILDTKEIKKINHDRGPRENPPKFKVVLDLKDIIKKDNNKIKDGIPLTKLAWTLCKEEDYDLARAIKSYKNDKIGFMKKYEEVMSMRKK
jgi:hypothetical protein